MADAFLILPDDSANTGKNLDTTSLTVNAQTVHRERMTISGATDVALAAVLNAAPTTEYGLVIRAAGVTKVSQYDGTNTETTLFDADSGAGSQFLQGVSLRKVASGGSVEAGTSSDPLRVDPTGTTIQPVSGTVTANLAAGTNSIGKLGSNSGVTIGAVEIAAAQTLATVTTVTAVTSITNALPSGTNTIGNVGVLPVTSGGCSIFHLVSAASTNQNNIKASAGQVYGWTVYNNSGIPIYLKFHNTAGTPTAGSGVVRTIGVQAGMSVSYSQTAGIAFGTGIAITIVGGIADNNTTAVGASDCVVDVEYK